MQTTDCPVPGCDDGWGPDVTREHFVHGHDIYEQKSALLGFIAKYDYPDYLPGIDTTFVRATPGRIRDACGNHPVFELEMYEAYFDSIGDAIREANLEIADTDYTPPNTDDDLARDELLELSNFGSELRQKYGPGWPEKRREALERDDCRCQVCATGNEDLEDGQKVEVHHIKPASRFHEEADGDVDYDAMNDLSNLVSLCSSCHGRIENDAVDFDAEVYFRSVV